MVVVWQVFLWWKHSWLVVVVRTQQLFGSVCLLCFCWELSWRGVSDFLIVLFLLVSCFNLLPASVTKLSWWNKEHSYRELLSPVSPPAQWEQFSYLSLLEAVLVLMIVWPNCVASWVTSPPRTGLGHTSYGISGLQSNPGLHSNLDLTEIIYFILIAPLPSLRTELRSMRNSSNELHFYRAGFDWE